MKFRQYKERQEESMDTCIDFYTQKELLDHILTFVSGEIDAVFSSRASKYDANTRWFVHDLMVKFNDGNICIAGFTNGYIEEFFAKDIAGTRRFIVREGGLSVDGDGIYETPKLEIWMPGSKPIGSPPDPEWITKGFSCRVLPPEMYDFTNNPGDEIATNDIYCVNCHSKSYESFIAASSWVMFTACKLCGHKHYWSEQDGMSGALYRFYLVKHGPEWPPEYWEMHKY